MRQAPPEEAALRWPEIEPLLRLATGRSDGAIEPIDLLVMAARGKVSLWLACDETGAVLAVVVVQITQMPRLRVCDVPFIGGRRGALRTWLGPMAAALEAHARAYGCRRMTGGLRRGWARAAGYREVGTQLMKDL